LTIEIHITKFNDNVSSLHLLFSFIATVNFIDYKNHQINKYFVHWINNENYVMIITLLNVLQEKNFEKN